MTALDRHRALLAAASAPRPWYANEHGDIKTGDGDTVLHQDSTLADPEDAALAAAAVNAYATFLDLWEEVRRYRKGQWASKKAAKVDDILAKLEAMQ